MVPLRGNLTGQAKMKNNNYKIINFSRSKSEVFGSFFVSFQNF
jgi:hypothetical protein